jgi:hypothetical protein
MYAAAAPALGAATAYDGGGAVGLSESLLSIAGSALTYGYRAAPALMIGLSLLLAFPVMAGATRIVAILRRAPDGTRRYRRRPAMLTKDVSKDVRVEPVTLPRRAFVEIVGARPVEIAIRRDMLRIGREDDNDIRIPAMGVHRYHAAIHREDLGDYRITDLSGLDGNGVIVNGQRCSNARLADGDMIELGPGRLRFHAGLT